MDAPHPPMIEGLAAADVTCLGYRARARTISRRAVNVT